MLDTTLTSTPARSLAVNLGLTVAGSVFLALMAQLAVPVPFSPIPISMQTLGVILLAGTMGSRLAASSVAAYLAEAMMGFPVLAGWVSFPAIWLLPSFGFLAGFVAAAWIAGRLLELRPESGVVYHFAACLTALVAVLLMGTLWLAPTMGVANAFAAGFLPFVLGEITKAAAAASLLRGLRDVRIGLGFGS